MKTVTKDRMTMIVAPIVLGIALGLGVPAHADAAVVAPPAPGAAQIQIGAGAYVTGSTQPTSIQLPAGSLGFVSAWVTVNAWGANQFPGGVHQQGSADVYVNGHDSGFGVSTMKQILSNGAPVIGPVFDAGSSYFVVVGQTYVGSTVTETLYVNGVATGSGTFTRAGLPTVVTSLRASVQSISGGVGASTTYSHVAYSVSMPNSDYAGPCGVTVGDAYYFCLGSAPASAGAPAATTVGVVSQSCHKWRWWVKRHHVKHYYWACHEFPLPR